MDPMGQNETPAWRMSKSLSRRFVFWGKSPTLPEVIQERTRADLAAARQRGRVGGRPKLLTAEKLAAATKLLANGTPARDVASVLGVSIPTLYRHCPASRRAASLELRKHGILESHRGRSGGYRLARPAHLISFGEVIRIIDGPLAPLPCASVTQFRLCADCPDPSRCSIRWLMQQMRDATAGVLDRCTPADALGKVPRAFPQNQVIDRPTRDTPPFERQDANAP
jgi:DNA-binding IscR family transcriptional regulator